MSWPAGHARSVVVEDSRRSSDWTDRAACVGVDPELWFPAGTSGPALDQLAAAKAVCEQCPVRGECLAWSLETRSEYGIFGGLTETERREARAAGRKQVAAA